MALRWFGRSRAATTAPPAQSVLHGIPAPAESPDNLVQWIKRLGPMTPNPAETERSIARIMSDLPVWRLAGIDFDMRWRSDWRSRLWDSMDRSDAVSTITGANDKVVVAAGFSMHRDGRIRQIAVEALVSADDSRALPWLVLRTGDWVPQVREPATRGVDQFLSDRFAADLVGILPLLDGGRFAAGRAASDMRARVDEVLARPACRDALLAGVEAHDRAVRRATLRLLLGVESSVSLLERVVQINDGVSIGLVAAAISRHGPDNLRAGELLMSSPLARYRAEGLWRLSREPGVANVADLISEGLFDRAASVRDVAQRWMATNEPNTDVREIYRQALPVDPLPALRGIGDLATDRDAELALEYADSNVAALRVASLRVLARLGRRSERDLFAGRFVSGTGKERREAIAGLRRSGGGEIVLDVWRRVVDQGDAVTMGRVLLQLVPLSDRWVRLQIGLEAAANPDAEVKAAGIESIHRTLESWNTGYPTEPQVEPHHLRELFDQARPSLRRHDSRRFHRDLMRFVESVLPDRAGDEFPGRRG